MLVFNERYETIIIDNVNTPLTMDYMWVLDYEIMDFKLSKLEMLEEVTCPCLEIDISGFKFIIPTDWFMLIYDEDTSQMDIVKISDMPGRDFTSVIYGHDINSIYGDKVKIVNYYPAYTIVRPSLSKNESLCHPISPKLWINIGPSDSYNRQIRECIVGDLINFIDKDYIEPVKNKNKKKR